MTEAKKSTPIIDDAANMDKLVAIAEGKMATSGDMVSIACKIPMGLWLHATKRVLIPRKTESGVIRDFEEWIRVGKEYMVYGPSHPQNQGPHCTIIGDYAITHNIPREHWLLWYSQHRNDAMVVNRMIFMNSSNKIAGEAREYKSTRSGLERMDPNKLPKGMKPDKDHMDADAYNKMMSGRPSSEEEL